MEVGIGIHGEPGRKRVPLAPAADVADLLLQPILGDLEFTGGDGVHGVRQRHGRHPADRAVPDVPRGQPRGSRRPGSRSPARWWARTSPASTWPAARSPCSSSTTSCSRLWDAPVQHARPCGGESDPHDGRDLAAMRRRRRRRCSRGWSSFAEEVAANRDLLTQLDSAIGDADHGANLDRGMTAVVAALAAGTSRATPAELFKTTGMTLVSTVGGASGPLYGTLFLRMAAQRRRRQTPRRRSSSRPPSGPGSTGIVARGRAEAGRQDHVRRSGTGLRRSDDAVAERGPLSRALAAAAEAADAGRDATIADAGAQGTGVVPGRAQRRPPGPRRHVGDHARRRPPRGRLG